nr:hypothetical protein GCM10020185_61150 [Pseudomonas brassicacearum subsp. brassicacearum]
MRNAYRSLREGPAGNYQLTYRVQLPDGSSRYLESRARLYRNDDGSPLRMAGTLLDITDQVEREQSLAASEEKNSPRCSRSAPTRSASLTRTAAGSSRSTPVSPRPSAGPPAT